MKIKFCQWCLKSVNSEDIVDIRDDRCPYCGAINEVKEVNFKLPTNASLISLKENIVVASYYNEFATWSLTAPIDNKVFVTYGHYYGDKSSAIEDGKKRLESISFTRYLPENAQVLEYNFKKQILLAEFIDENNVKTFATWKVLQKEESTAKIAYGNYFATLEEAKENYIKRVQ